MTGSFADRVAAASAQLTDVEREILTGVLGSEDAAFLSAAELGARHDVHETTVIRLAKKIGYAGYRDFRAALRDTSTRADRMLAGRARPRGEQGSSLLGYLRDEADALLRLADLVGDEQLARVANLLAGARRVYVLGLPMLVDTLATRLRRVGIDTHAVNGGPRRVAENLVGAGPHDVVVAFAVRPVGADLDRLLPYLAGRGARIIVISDVAGATLPVDAVERLTVLRGADDVFRTLVVPTALCYAIELALYRVEGSAAETSLAELDHIAGLVTGEPARAANKNRKGSR